ncbi:MAG: thioesterase family protein [Betaproteobacteria bacterium]
MDLTQIQPGLKGSVEIVVGEEHTAPHVGSGRVRVLATPIMINLMEAAALQAVEGLLPAGHQTVGIHLDVTHVAATPVGMRVRAHAELMRVDKRTLFFDVSAEDEKERIGGGLHERIVINLAKFDGRMQDKLGMIRPA